MIYGKEISVLPSKSDVWKNGVVLSFDLDTIKLRDYYSKTSPQGAYEVIKHFLKKNGFKHEKDSDYVNDKIDKITTAKLIYNFSKSNKWFPLCINKMNISPNVESLDISLQIVQLADKKWKAKKDKENLLNKE